jgi:hypothetical protein
VAVDRSSVAFAGIFAAVLVCGAMVCAAFVAGERAFPYWDFAFYETQTLRAADAFRVSPLQGIRFIRESLGEDYNYLCTLPLVPWTVVFGEARIVFIASLYFSYFAPYVLLAALLARRLANDQPLEAMAVAAIVTVATPAAWHHLLLGYPDVGGAALMAGCVVVYGLWRGAPRALLIPVLGVLAGLAIAFRRHYAYAVVALFVALACDAVIALRRSPTGERGPVALRGMVLLLVAPLVTLLTLLAVVPGFVSRALASGPWESRMASWQLGIRDTLVTMLDTVGVVPLLLAIVGWAGALPVVRAAPELRVVALATAAWVTIWATLVRQAPYHYPHWLPLFVALGLTASWTQLARMRRAAWRVAGRVVIAGVVATTLASGIPLVFPSATGRRTLLLFPGAVPPRVHPGYDEIVSLVTWLRSIATRDDPIVVAASSALLNFDLLRSAEAQLVGRRNAVLDFRASPQADSVGVLPTQDLLSARFVIVVTPFQHHLGAGNQKVVRVVVDAFENRWPVARDFELLPRTFSLGEPGTRVQVYRRLRPANDDVVSDTERRVAHVVLNTPLDSPTWFVRTSPYPVQFARTQEGRHRITAHPTRVSQQPKTVLELRGVTAPVLRISGRVWFYDERCPGAEIVAADSDAPASRPMSIGVFRPVPRGRAFERDLSAGRDAVISLEVRSSPEHPELIDYCALVIDDVELRDAGGTRAHAR